MEKMTAQWPLAKYLLNGYKHSIALIKVLVRVVCELHTLNLNWILFNRFQFKIFNRSGVNFFFG